MKRSHLFSWDARAILVIGLLVGYRFSSSAGNGPNDAIAFVSTNERYMDNSSINWQERGFDSRTAWKGERISYELMVLPKRDFSNVTLQFSDFKSAGGQQISAAAAAYGAVRFVSANQSGGMCGNVDQTLPEIHVGDAIAPQGAFSLKNNALQPIWITVSVPRTASPGQYTSTISIQSDQGAVDKITFSLTVRDRLLPDPSQWAFHLDLWQFPLRVSSYYKVPAWSPQHFEKMRPVMEALAQAGQKCITTSFFWDNFNTNNWGKDNLMIRLNKQPDGTFTYDYSNFDKWVSFMMGLGIKDEILVFGMFPFNNNLNSYYFDQSQQKDVVATYKLSSNEYNDFWTKMLTSFAAHLREKGWMDKTVLFFDERPAGPTAQVIKLIKSVEPAFKIGYSGAYNGQLEPDVYDLSIVSYLKIPPDILEKRARDNKVTTFYNTCTTKAPNLFTFSQAGEAELMGWMAYANDYKGYVRYSLNQWEFNSLTESRSRVVPSGDQFIVYPENYKSVRFEKLLEGIQDYEKIDLLHQGMRGKALGQLDNLLSQCTIDQINANGNRDFGAFIDNAETVLNSL